MALDRWKKKKDKKQPEKAKIRVYVATPAYDGKVDTDYAVSLAESCMLATAMGIHVTAAVMGNGAFIDLARNNFVHMFLEETDCTHLFFIDADLKWEPRAFVGLLTAGKPICAGVYRRRQEPEDYPVRYIEEEVDGEVGVTPEDGWIKCDRVPTGFLCIERKVIEEMASESIYLKQGGFPPVPRLFYTPILPVQDEMHKNGKQLHTFMGEDYAFAEDYCRKYKTHIPVWPNISFVHGGYPCNWQDYIMRKVAEIEEMEKKEAANG